MEHQPETELDVTERTDHMQSSYGATLQSRDFGDTRYFPDVAVLEDMYRQWDGELLNPDRSPRSIKEIRVLLGRLIFEIAYRNGTTKRETEKLEDAFRSEAHTPVRQIFAAEDIEQRQQAA